jgi:hypothetical protein
MMQIRSFLTRFTAAVLLVAGTSFTLLACRKHETPAEETPAPAVVGDESDAVLKTKYHADDAFTLVQSDRSYRALVFKLPKASEADSDYRVIAYRRQGNAYLRHGAEMNLVNFERPRLSTGAPPRIETTMNRLGVRYHIALDQKGAELVPSEGIMDGGFLIGHPETR